MAVAKIVSELCKSVFFICLFFLHPLLQFMRVREEGMKVLESNKEEKMNTLSSKSLSSEYLDELNFFELLIMSKNHSNNVSIRSIDYDCIDHDDANGIVETDIYLGPVSGGCFKTTEEENLIYYEYLHSIEIQMKRRPIPDYIQKIQIDITTTMRGILVDWLVEVAEGYELISDTLYLAVSYLDRYLSLKPLNRQRLQLLGVTCMFIASKYEEGGVLTPSVEHFCSITNNAYNHEDVVKMEVDILKVLNFEMGNPTIKSFLDRFIRGATNFEVDCEKSSLNSYLECLACYLAELSLLDCYSCSRFLPSLVAASTVFLTQFTIQPEIHPWNSILERYTGYKPCDLKECVMVIHDLQLNRRANDLVAIRSKYKQDKFKCVSTWRSQSKIPTAYFK